MHLSANLATIHAISLLFLGPHSAVAQTTDDAQSFLRQVFSSGAITVNNTPQVVAVNSSANCESILQHKKTYSDTDGIIRIEWRNVFDLTIADGGGEYWIIVSGGVFRDNTLTPTLHFRFYSASIRDRTLRAMSHIQSECSQNNTGF